LPQQGTPEDDTAGANSIEMLSLITATVTTAPAPQDVERPGKGTPKLESSLSQLLEAYERGGLSEAQAFAEMYQMVLEDSRLQVTLVATEGGAKDLIQAVESLGGEYQGHHETLLQAMIPLDALEILVRRPDVQAIRQPRRAAR
jgi:hypothetical protein